MSQHSVRDMLSRLRSRGLVVDTPNGSLVHALTQFRPQPKTSLRALLALWRARPEGMDFRELYVLLKSKGYPLQPSLKWLLDFFRVADFRALLPAMARRPLQPLVFSTELTSGGLAALGGWARVTVNPDGSTRWQGHAHDSGVDAYDLQLAAYIPPVIQPAGAEVGAPTRTGLSFLHTGHAGSDDDNWDERQPANPMISKYIDCFVGSQMQRELEYSSVIGEALEKLTTWILKWAAGSMLAPWVGAVVFAGVEAGTLISGGSLAGGARFASGFLWLAGPYNTLYALAADGLTRIAANERMLHQEEYEWANSPALFAGSLPPRDMFRINDGIGFSGRPFTFPKPTGMITISIGDDAFGDPRSKGVAAGTKYYGEVLVHELVHVCQIWHRRTQVSFIAEGMAQQICKWSGIDDPYVVPAPGFDFTDLGLEAQANVVSFWYCGRTSPTKTWQDINSPYFRYILDMRAGQF